MENKKRELHFLTQITTIAVYMAHVLALIIRIDLFLSYQLFLALILADIKLSKICELSKS